MEFSVTYPPCQTCHAKVHCRKCEKELLDSLLRNPGITAASLTLPSGTAVVEGNLPEYEVEDELERCGLLT